MRVGKRNDASRKNMDYVCNEMTIDDDQFHFSFVNFQFQFSLTQFVNFYFYFFGLVPIGLRWFIQRENFQFCEVLPGTITYAHLPGFPIDEVKNDPHAAERRWGTWFSFIE